MLEALAAHGLTLQNFSSVQEQQMGGWTQVAAHGTGASLPTYVCMYVMNGFDGSIYIILFRRLID